MNDAATSGLASTGADCLDRARALIPLLQSAVTRIDAAHELPGDVLDVCTAWECSACCCRGPMAGSS
jgi:hypothetical protein